MKPWLNVVSIGRFMRMYKRGDLMVEDVAALVAIRLRKLKIGDFGFDLLIASVDCLRLGATREQFNKILDQLYDWGDSGNRLLIDTEVDKDE